MKKILTLTSLFALFAAAATELAASSGVHLPVTLDLGAAFAVFTLVTFALIVFAEYGPKTRPIALKLHAAIPASRRQSIAAAHHHVYAIRRGVEAARLARVPTRVIYFPRRAPVRCQRAA